MMKPCVQRITDDNPDWLDFGIDCIRDVQTRGDLVFWIATEHDYMDELVAEFIPRGWEAEFILEVFNDNHNSFLYIKLRELMWEHCKAEIESFMEKNLDVRREPDVYPH